MAHWEVRIDGDEAQLRMLAVAFSGPEWIVALRGSKFFLSGAALEGLPDARAVRDKASARALPRSRERRCCTWAARGPWMSATLSR